jgi:hypothetical protein
VVAHEVDVRLHDWHIAVRQEDTVEHYLKAGMAELEEHIVGYVEGIVG